MNYRTTGFTSTRLHLLAMQNPTYGIKTSNHIHNVILLYLINVCVFNNKIKIKQYSIYTIVIQSLLLVQM